MSLTPPEPNPSDLPQASAPYAGEPLGPHPHVAVIFRDQIGDFVVATPLMRALRDRYPDLTLDYFGGERTRELEEASALVDARFSIYGVADPLSRLQAFLAGRRRHAGPYSLAINLESDRLAAQTAALIGANYVVGTRIDAATGDRIPAPDSGIDALWYDKHWNRADLLRDFPALQSPYIGELFARLAHVEGLVPPPEVPVAEPPFSTPPLLISTGANRSAKLWTADHWLSLVRALRTSGYEIGLLGAAPAQGAYHAGDVDQALIEVGMQDLRGRLTLPQVAGALAHAAGFVTVDNGLMHLAAAVGTPTIALFGASPRRLWAPPVPNVHVLEPTDPCPRCEENRFRNADCLLPVHQCLLSVTPERVRAEVERLLASPG
jgi:heptosyltransferase III